MNMPGADRTMLKQMMKEKDIVSAEELLEIARESAVKLVTCSITMQVMCIREDGLRQDYRGWQGGKLTDGCKPFGLHALYTVSLKEFAGN